MVRSTPSPRTAPRRRLGFGNRSANGTAPRSRRQGTSSEDRALYACGCGYAFSADVSTSVACPHCGRVQAW